MGHLKTIKLDETFLLPTFRSPAKSLQCTLKIFLTPDNFDT
jgi:hypothetical protein